MSNMVKRVTEVLEHAIERCEFDGEPCRLPIHEYENVARAAIAAMREPDDPNKVPGRSEGLPVMSKTVRDILTEQMVGPSPGWSIDDAEADAIIAALDAAGFVIVSKEPSPTSS